MHTNIKSQFKVYLRKNPCEFNEVVTLDAFASFQWAQGWTLRRGDYELRNHHCCLEIFLQIWHAWVSWAFMGRFPHPKDAYVNYFSWAVCSFRPFWKWVGGLWGSWVVLIPAYSLCPLPAAHSCVCAVWCCGCLSQKNALSLLSPPSAAKTRSFSWPCK